MRKVERPAVFFTGIGEQFKRYLITSSFLQRRAHTNIYQNSVYSVRAMIIKSCVLQLSDCRMRIIEHLNIFGIFHLAQKAAPADLAG
jgi:hypothetical protein